MSELREAAQLAVTMLKTGAPEYNTDDVIEVLEAALAEPVQEPVAWRCADGSPSVVFQQYPQALEDLGIPIEPLYTAPPQHKENT